MVAAMMLVVGGMTAIVLYFARRNAEAADQVRLQNEFQGELGRQLGSQEARRGAIAERCRTLARSVRIVAALEEGEPADLYLNARIELRDVLENRWDGADDGFPRLLRARTFCFLDAGGAVISKSGQNEAGAAESWERQLDLEQVPERQETGYVVLTGNEGRELLHEVIVTPIISPSTGETIGAIALLFTPVHFRTSSENSGMKRGIFVNGHFYLPSDSPDEAAFARGIATAEVGASLDADSGTTVRVNGAPYLVFSNAINPGSPFPIAHQVSFYPIAASLDRRAEQQTRIAVVGFLVFVAALGASYVVSSRLSKPVEQLAEDSVENLVQRERAEAALELTEQKYRQHLRKCH